MILLCFSGAVIAYFQITILPNIIKQTLKQLDVNVAIFITISIIMFIITCSIAARLTKYFKIKTITAFGLVLMVVLSLAMYALYKANNDLLIVFFVVMGRYLWQYYGAIYGVLTQRNSLALAYNIDFGVFGSLIAILMLFPC